MTFHPNPTFTLCFLDRTDTPTSIKLTLIQSCLPKPLPRLHYQSYLQKFG